MKYDKQKCPKCRKPVKALYRPSMSHPGPNLCYWCNKRRIKEEKEMSVQK